MPDLLVLGQVVVDHAVPAMPGPWREALGGNALYAAAGARLWCDPGRVGVVTRLGHGLAADVTTLLARAGLPTGGLREVDTEPLVEWHLYERDGSRRSFPRNAALRDPAADAATHRQRYLIHLESLSPTTADIPRAWLPTRAAHVAPQVAARHGSTVPWLEGRADWIGVDPSPHYATHLKEAELAMMLVGACALLPSRAEVEHRAPDGLDRAHRALARGRLPGSRGQARRRGLSRGGTGRRIATPDSRGARRRPRPDGRGRRVLRRLRRRAPERPGHARGRPAWSDRRGDGGRVRRSRRRSHPLARRGPTPAGRVGRKRASRPGERLPLLTLIRAPPVPLLGHPISVNQSGCGA
jgi:hypothetical protein